MGGFAGSGPAISIACCADPDSTTRSRNSSSMAEFCPNDVPVTGHFSSMMRLALRYVRLCGVFFQSKSSGPDVCQFPVTWYLYLYSVFVSTMSGDVSTIVKINCSPAKNKNTLLFHLRREACRIVFSLRRRGFQPLTTCRQLVSTLLHF